MDRLDRLSRDHDDGDVSDLSNRRLSPSDLPAVNPRTQIQIEEHDVGELRSEEIDSPFAMRGPAHAMAHPFQGHDERSPLSGIILDD